MSTRRPSTSTTIRHAAAALPGQRPYPNPLDPGDGTSAGTDYDDDGLLLREEFPALAQLLDDGVRRGSRPQGRWGR